jgi:DNA-binding transcriptional MerR regulator
MIRIGDFSKLCRVSIRMLRHYDEMGLLTPAKVDDTTGYRYYAQAQLQTANRITALRGMGFSLASIAEIMKEYHDAEALYGFLSVKLSEMREEERGVKTRLQLIQSAMKRLRKDGVNMKYDVTAKTLPKRHVASLRGIIPSYDKESALWQQMQNETGCNMTMANPCYSLAIFHDEAHKESDVDVEIQIAVQGDYKNTANVVFKQMEPLEIASAVYKGSYDLVTEVCEAVAAWVSDNGYDYSGPMFCIYHVSPAETSNPENLVTEVCFPIKKR